jgi:hypothetical protein
VTREVGLGESEGEKTSLTCIQDLLDSARERADQLVGEHWRAIVMVAAQLRERRELGGAEMAGIVRAERRAE